MDDHAGASSGKQERKELTADKAKSQTNGNCNQFKKASCHNMARSQLGSQRYDRSHLICPITKQKWIILTKHSYKDTSDSGRHDSSQNIFGESKLLLPQSINLSFQSLAKFGKTCQEYECYQPDDSTENSHYQSRQHIHRSSHGENIFSCEWKVELMQQGCVFQRCKYSIGDCRGNTHANNQLDKLLGKVVVSDPSSIAMRGARI
mmetsp:Transcript_15974/g.22829  ORF Transcript_15974/g.22829 Transcript_15974/m.22829 type:complete len:205 (-) Transcript_15974:1020-1634(-)